MAEVTKIESVEDACKAFYITPEQLQRCQAIYDAETGKWFYIVESQSLPGVRYAVAYNRQYKALQCLPYNGGPACKASDAGFGCWHRRAARAAHVLYRNEVRKVQEQEAMEALEARSVIREQSLITRLVGMGYNLDEARRIAYESPASLSDEEYAKILKIARASQPK